MELNKDEFIMSVESEVIGDEDIILVGVDVYAHGVPEDLKVFHQDSRIVVYVNDRLTYDLRLSGITGTELLLGMHWSWTVSRPLVLCHKENPVACRVVAGISSYKYAEKKWDEYTCKAQFRAWTFPLITGAENPKFPAWFEQWKSGKLDIPAEYLEPRFRM